MKTILDWDPKSKITDPDILEIFEYLKKILKDVLRDYASNGKINLDKIYGKQPNRGYIELQFVYMKDISKVYISYNLSNEMMNHINVQKFNNYFNMYINANMQYDTGIYPEILFAEDDVQEKTDESYILTPYTIGYWLSMSGKLSFLEDERLVMQDLNLCNIVDYGEDYNKEHEQLYKKYKIDTLNRRQKIQELEEEYDMILYKTYMENKFGPIDLDTYNFGDVDIKDESAVGDYDFSDTTEGADKDTVAVGDYDFEKFAYDTALAEMLERVTAEFNAKCMAIYDYYEPDTMGFTKALEELKLKYKTYLIDPTKVRIEDFMNIVTELNMKNKPTELSEEDKSKFIKESMNLYIDHHLDDNYEELYNELLSRYNIEVDMNKRIPEIFNEYAEKYKEFFGTELKEIVAYRFLLGTNIF